MSRPVGLGSFWLALAGFACAGPPAPAWEDARDHRSMALVVSRRGGEGFTMLAPRRTGIDFANRVSETRRLQHPNSLIGSGVALGDVDGDGRVDVYLNRLDGPNALYRNLGNWRFEDIADQAGVAAADRASTGAVLGDLDGDRDLDLLLTSLAGPNSLFVNDGTGTFTEHTTAAGLASGRGSTTPTLADVDGDGDLDLYVANYKAANALDLFPPQERTFDRVVVQVGDRYEIAPRFREHYRVRVMPDLDIVARVQRGEPDAFYLNDGTGRFQAVPWSAGRFRDDEGRLIADEPDYFALTARFQDMDGDGDPDLYVCNDFEDPDLVWLNDGTGTFRALPRLALRATSNAAMAIDFADVDRDGDMDFFEADMLSRDPRRRQRQIPSHTALPKLVGHLDDRPQLQRNTLFLNRGDATYAQAAEHAGVTASDWSWATLFLDVDLDGYEDILVANGHVWDVQDADADMRARGSAGRVDWRRRALLYPDLHQYNAAFRNNGDLTFDDVSAEWRFGTEADVSHGLATGDLDGDGDLDVVINRLGFPAAVLRNDATAPRLAVRLRGESPNTHGIGATIRVVGGPVPAQMKEVTLGGLYLSSSDPGYAFAAGSADSLTIEVRWRSGRRSVIAGARPNRLYEIRESGARAAEAQPDSTSRAKHFADASGVLGHRHHETRFDDFARQPLLPNELSRLGPGVTWYDVDGDGDEDLLVPSGRGGSLAYQRNDGDRFTSFPLLDGAVADQTTVLALPATAGGTTLLLGQSNYETQTPTDALRLPAVVRLEVAADGKVRGSARVVVPGDTSSPGPLALADIDSDGDLDLFVGGRVVPTAYPVAATSRLLRNDGGHFVLDSANQAPLASVGLVSAATFSDLDGDGDPDLILALEWGPLRVYRNDAGRFSESDASRTLGHYRSRWNGVTTGDLDSDGRPDIVATSWGRNTTAQPSPERPILLYYGDFDRNGTVDAVEAQLDPVRRGVYPLAPYPRMRSAMPSMRMRIPSFAAYADAALEAVIGRPADATPSLHVSTLAHMVFLNRGSTFEPRPLPTEAQLAPAFYAGVADFDGDGREDLFLSQNFFPTELETPRYDAGRGLLLLGDGTGTLTAVPGQLSGITVYGDQRGAAFADYDRDGRLDLAVSQNGTETKLYRNVGAAPGLRVRLVGPPENPHAVGAGLRVVYLDHQGPLREIHGGTGYWSQNGAVQVLGAADQATGVWVRWPDGSETEVPISPAAREVTIAVDGSADQRSP